MKEPIGFFEDGHPKKKKKKKGLWNFMTSFQAVAFKKPESFTELLFAHSSLHATYATSAN